MSSDRPILPKVIFSFDFEIGWGDILYNHVWKRREAADVYVRLREVLPQILREMDAMELPATWATVGAMVDDPSQRNFDHLPLEAATLLQSALREGRPESFNGQDLFEQVVEARVGHDIACHSYSHIPFTYDGFEEEVAREDLRAWVRTMAKYEIGTDRLVFPENRENHYQVLDQEGFEIIRVAADTKFRNRWLYLASIAVVPPPLGYEKAGEAGLTRHHGSMLYNDAGQQWRVPLLKRRVKLGLDRLLKENGVFHIWSHPFNFAESDTLRDGFLKVLRKVADARDKGKLIVTPM